MYYLFLDETNSVPSAESRFFIYGGVFFKDTDAEAIHVGVEKIREKYGFEKEDPFKFNSKSRPKNVSLEKFSQAKQDTLELCSKHDVRFISYLIKHHIAKNKLENNIKWASCEIVDIFDSFLRTQKSYGVCIFDRLPFKNDFSYLESLFQKGITTALENKNQRTPKNIILYSASSINASHLNSVSDIILGAFRYCVNASQTQNDAFKLLMPRVRKLFHYHACKNGKRLIAGYGLIVRPHVGKLYDNGETEINNKFSLKDLTG